jgi:hypothetical protein
MAFLVSSFKKIRGGGGKKKNFKLLKDKKNFGFF